MKCMYICELRSNTKMNVFSLYHALNVPLTIFISPQYLLSYLTKLSSPNSYVLHFVSQWAGGHFLFTGLERSNIGFTPSIGVF